MKANKWYQKTRLDYQNIQYPEQLRLTKTNKDQYHEELREIQFGAEPLLRELDDLCLCSDAYFPQVDNIKLAHKYGIKYIAAPMGSIRDNDVIEECNKSGITLYNLTTGCFIIDSFA